MVVLLALLAKILADIVETLRVEYQNIKNLLLRKKLTELLNIEHN